MCRMAFITGLNSEYVEDMREMWIDNGHGWGLVFKDKIVDGKYILNKKGKYEYIRNEYIGLKEWRTINSDVPIAWEKLPKKLDGIFHIRYATVSRELGGVHPFVIDLGDEQYVYSHNGVIHGYDIDRYDVDSEIIGDLFMLNYMGDMYNSMIETVKRLNGGLYDGYWNILMADKSMRKLFAYSDGSLMIFKKDGKFCGISSDDKWDRGLEFDFIEIPEGEYIYMEKENNKWKVVDEGRIEKNISKGKYLWDDVGLYEEEYIKYWGWKE